MTNIDLPPKEPYHAYGTAYSAAALAARIAALEAELAAVRAALGAYHDSDLVSLARTMAARVRLMDDAADANPRPQTLGAALAALDGCGAALTDALAELRHATAQRERAIRHALRYRRQEREAWSKYSVMCWREAWIDNVILRALACGVSSEAATLLWEALNAPPDTPPAR